MQHDRKRRLGANKFAIDFDVVARARLRAKVCTDFTVDDNATRCDQLVAVATRTDPSGSEETV